MNFSIFQSPLTFACLSGNLDLVDLLLDQPNIEKIADREEPTSSNLTPLMISVKKGHVEIVDALLRSGKVDVNKRNENGFAAIHLASIEDLPECIQVLVDHGCDINLPSKEATPRTPIEYAIMNGNRDCVNTFG